MKSYTSPKIDIFYIKVEETFANGSAITKPSSYEDVKTEWDIGVDQQSTHSWE